MFPKNYRINLMDKTHKYVTAEQAAKIFMLWISGGKGFVVDGDAFACHQIANIKRLKKEDEEVKFGELLNEKYDMKFYLNSGKELAII